jgi:surfactin synthase thioesterase subunit
LREKPHTRLLELAEAVCAGIGPDVKGPCAFFGHSFGAIVAFEVVRALRRRGEADPVHLFVSSRQGPTLSNLAFPLHRLSDEVLLDHLRARYGGVPEAVLREPELLQLLLPALRADLEALETYAYEPAVPLSCPIAAFAGSDDRWATLVELEAWRRETTGPFTVRRFAGGHFYLQGAESPLLEEIVARLAAVGLPVATQAP